MNERMVGQTVYEADGRELGRINEVRGGYVKVDARMQPDYWLSTDAVSSTEDRLVVSGDAQRVENPTFDALETGTAPDHTHERTGSTMQSTSTPVQASGPAHERERESVQLREERARVETQQEQAGEVRLGTRVTEHEETVNVPLREERVVIERTPVQGDARQGEITGEEQTIEVPLMREQANVEKETVVAEEVNVRTETTERQKEVQTTLRKEELEVQGEGDVRTSGQDREPRRS